MPAIIEWARSQGTTLLSPTVADRLSLGFFKTTLVLYVAYKNINWYFNMSLSIFHGMHYLFYFTAQ